MGSTPSSAGAAARAWRPALGAGVGAAASTLPPPLTVVTYNILADKYATSGAHAYCPPQFLAWPYRKQRILQQVLDFQADLLCLQEVERAFFEGELEPLLAEHGYEGLYASRPRRPVDPPSVPEEGIGLLFRRERLERQASRAVRFADVVPPALSGAKFWEAVKKREDGALLALLRDRASGRSLLAGCTHLYYDPRFPDIKLAQSWLLCRAAVTFLRGQPALGGLAPEQLAARVPVILCGDFNSLAVKRRSDAFDTVPPGGALVGGVYRLLAGEEVDPTHQDHPARRSLGGGARGARDLSTLLLGSRPLRLRSAAAAAWGREPPLTNCTPSFRGCLDYCWLSQGHWAVREALELPYRFDPAPPGAPAAVVDPEHVTDLPPLPDERHPSDHLPLGFRLTLLPPNA
ncbi:Ccr4p [Micractinium conductrix]|uniref:Ccr4p n=1 Tax=Micractinium conductrix TaxID=554055 RepID=A0A2P6VIU9_9CHLO|nr:Ccr4p [Micractinium conductrix]|eukprot:PSC74002.1 Ccr4p [Micractinium conductrix]